MRHRWPVPGRAPLVRTCSTRPPSAFAIAAHMPQIVEVQTRHASVRARGVPDLPEVGPAQLAALRADKDQAPLPWLGEPVQVPAQLRHKLGREGDGPTTGP